MFKRGKKKNSDLLIDIDEPDTLQYLVVYQHCLKVLTDQMQLYVSKHVHCYQYSAKVSPESTISTTTMPFTMPLDNRTGTGGDNVDLTDTAGHNDAVADSSLTLKLHDQIRQLWFLYLDKVQQKGFNMYAFLKRATRPVQRSKLKSRGKINTKGSAAAGVGSSIGSGKRSRREQEDEEDGHGHSHSQGHEDYRDGSDGDGDNESEGNGDVTGAVRTGKRKRGRPKGKRPNTALNDYANTSPDSSTVLPTKPLLLGFLYLAVRLLRDVCIIPQDIVRWCEQGLLSYTTLWFSLPLEMKAAVGVKYKSLLDRDVHCETQVTTVTSIEYHAAVRNNWTSWTCYCCVCVVLYICV